MKTQAVEISNHAHHNTAEPVNKDNPSGRKPCTQDGHSTAEAVRHITGKRIWCTKKQETTNRKKIYRKTPSQSNIFRVLFIELSF